MRTEFLHKHVIDVILLQEVTHTEFDLVRGYNAYTSVKISVRGTAMLITRTIQLNDLTWFPPGGDW